jgi:glycosyltransferase involved in cell wall biosynthesis
MRLLFVTKGDIHESSSKYRAFRVADQLKGKVDSEIFTPSCLDFCKLPWKDKASSLLSLLKKSWALQRGDVLYVQRAIYSRYMLLALGLAKYVLRTKTVFDLDDAVFLNYPGRINFMLRISDAVFAGSHYVQDYARRYNLRTHLLPTSLPFEIYERYAKDQTSSSRKKIIGWLGDGPAHYPNLVPLVGAFNILAERRNDFRFVLIGAKSDQRIYDHFANLKNVEYELIDWIDGSNEEAVAAAVRDFDIGLMPLQDIDWSRGKCALKALQYMACGAVPIVSPVGENLHVVQQDVTGLFASAPAEWASQMERLLKDDQFRLSLGRNAREYVRKEYSYQTTVPQMLEVLRGI